ncbi:MAG: CopD family protein [Acidocella sp.]|nr:CopD family protein [Acidocella sp.]
MDVTGWVLLRAFCRGLHLAGFFSAFGTMFLSATLLHKRGALRLRRLAWAGFAVACLGGAGWFLLQAADFAAAQSISDVIGALPIVAGQTRFGTLLLTRMGLLLLAMLLFQRGWPRSAALIAFGGVVAEAWLGHGGAMTGFVGTMLLFCAVLHIAAAAIWLGALPALYVALKRLPEDALLPLAQSFSPLGMACVGTLLVTAMFQFILLITYPQALFTTAYGAVALTKLVLFAALIALAVLNRFRFTPSLPASRPALLRNIGAEAVLGLAVLLAAGLILQLEPPAMADMAGM